MIYMSKQSGLTKRQKEIIEMLAQFTFSNPVTVQAISEKLKLSSRTILRELPKIEQWMEENDFHMVRKPRVGIYLEETKANRELIMELVRADKTKGSELNREERINHIKGEILASEEPLKYFYFTSQFNISEGTLVGDFDEIEKWMKNYGLTLVRRKGLGVYWTGREQDYRQAVVASMLAELIWEDRTSAESKERRMSLPLFRLYSENELFWVRDLIKSVEQNLKIRYTDNAFRRMEVMLSVTIGRIRMGYIIEEDQEDIRSLMKYPEYQAATWIGSMLESEFSFSISQNEIAVLTMQLLGAKVWQPHTVKKDEAENLKNRQMVIHLILKMEQILDMDFLDDRMLIDGLCNHIGPAISRMKMHVHIENNNVDMLKQKYKDIFDAVKFASRVIETEIGVDTICDEELGFIALHFCASMEKHRTERGKIPVMVACPNGIGTSHMLAVHLQKAFPELIVRKVVATSDINEQMLKELGIGLIVSTVQLNINFPCVCVNSVLLENDRILVRNMIKDLQKVRVEKKKSAPMQRKRIRQPEIEYFVTLGTEIIQTVENVKISIQDEVESEEELIKIAANLFAKNDSCAQIIERDLTKREEIADTYVPTFRMMFLHSATRGVDHCRFGYISLKKTYKDGQRQIVGAIVMLVPHEPIQKTIYQEVMSEVSGLLAEDEQMVSYLQDKKRNEVAFQLEKGLGNYYQRVMKEYGDF